MYDFLLGSANENIKNEKGFLLAIKRMLPKWMNSVPDSEYLAISDIIKSYLKSKVTLVETGVGASTIVLFYWAARRGGKLFSWDTNGEKASQIRGVLTETIGKNFGIDVCKSWHFVNSESLSEYTGLGILKELGEKVDLFFHDSEHTLDTILAEISLIKTVLKNKSIICLDDAN